MVPPFAGKSPARFERALLSPPRPLYYNPRETERGHRQRLNSTRAGII